MWLTRLYASEAPHDAARERDDLAVVEEAGPLEFDGGEFADPSPDPPA